MSDYIKIKLNDNTITKNLTHTAHEKGVSEYERHFIPNEGVTDDGDVIHFYPYNLIRIDNEIHVVDKSNIFLENGYLQKPGVIVQKYFVEMEDAGFILGDQTFFKVIISNVDAVKVGSLILIIANQCMRFNYDESEYFFVNKDSVFLCLGDATKAGPDYILLEVPESKLLGANNDKSNYGYSDGIKYYFDQAMYELDINGKRNIVVKKRDLKLRCK